MLRLRAFGAPVVERLDGEPLEGAARQRRVLALLAIVAAGRHRGVSRDRVLALLWSESEPDKARQSLTQSLYHTRKALGADDVFLAAADLRLNPDVISTDVNEFEDALESGALERAVSLYEGPFLDGFFVNAAPEFERWVSEERARLQQRYARALQELSQTATAAGDHTRAADWRTRLAALDPLNSRYALEAMRAMAAAGDRAGAIRHARMHESLLREELNAAANPAIVELAERLRESPLWFPPPHIAASAEPNAAATASITSESAALRRDLPSVATRRRTLWVAATAALALVLTVALIVARQAPRRIVRAPSNLTVVAPFRVAGADPALAYLREGLVDLLVAKLIDDNESAAIDAGAVMTAWRQAGFGERPDVPQGDALRIARQLGGTRLLIGSVVGTPASFVVNATLLHASNGTLLAQASAGGAADSLTGILDRLVARLLAKEAGEWERLANRTSTSVLALRAYLDGQTAYRRGAYRDAVRHFKTALERDASFAMAGLALANAAERLGSGDDRARGLAAAWGARDELTVRDSVYLAALAGPHYPAESSLREQLSAWERAAAVTPDRADVWHELGERLFFDGRVLGVSDWAIRAAAAFRRSAELDPGFASPLQYLLQLAAAAGDSVGVRLLAAAYVRIDSVGDLAPFVRWRAAIARGDSATLRTLRRRLATFPTSSLRSIVLSSQFNGIGIGDAERAVAAIRARAARGTERTDALLAGHALALNTGKLEAAQEITQALAEDPARVTLSLRLRVLNALYGGGNVAAAQDAAARLTRMYPRDAAAMNDAQLALRSNQALSECVVAQWRSWTTEDADTVARALRESSASPRAEEAACSALVDAIVAVRTRQSEARSLIARFDSLLALMPRSEELHEYAGLALARMYAADGDNQRALDAVRRRPHMRQWPHYLATFLMEEGKLASAMGDTAAALVAYRHYLALRRTPDAEALNDVESARSEVQQIRQRPERK